MVNSSGPAKLWAEALRAASKRRGMKYVSETAYAVDHVYLATLVAQVRFGDEPVFRYTVNIKPLAVNEIFWAAFMPEVHMTAQMRINRRINGAFLIRPLTIASGTAEPQGAGVPEWEPILDEFERTRAAFTQAHPTVEAFAEAQAEAQGRLQSGHAASGTALPLTITALIAAGRGEEAASLAEQAISRGEHSGMSSTVDSLKHLSAYAKGPLAYAAFAESLIPTHELHVISETAQRPPRALPREHSSGNFGRHLAALDGRETWAVVLDALPPAGAANERAALRYLQAAGSAEAMMVEHCRPVQREAGVMAVRSIVGHPGAAEEPLDITLPLPRVTERIAASEIFAAEEAAALFETFYRTDTLPGGYEFRDAEAYGPGGDSVDLRGGESRD